MDALVAAHITAKQRLQHFASLGAARAWDSLPHYDEQNVGQFLSMVLALLTGANLQAVALTEAFLARALERQPIGVDARQVVVGIRNGTAPEEVYRRPFVTTWSALSEGKPWEDAVRIGRERAATAAATDVQLAFRDTLAAVGEADRTVMGYERVADPGACAFCLAVNGAQFRKADALPLHPLCGCGVRVVPYTRGKHFEPTPTPEAVAVHEHGELGPVLTDPAHDFTTEHEALAA